MEQSFEHGTTVFVKTTRNESGYHDLLVFNRVNNAPATWVESLYGTRDVKDFIKDLGDAVWEKHRSASNPEHISLTFDSEDILHRWLTRGKTPYSQDEVRALKLMVAFSSELSEYVQKAYSLEINPIEFLPNGSHSDATP